MKLQNNTPQDVGYWVNWNGGADCGTISMDGTVDNGTWTNQQYEVKFYALPNDPNMTPSSIEISETGTGTSVTIGLYYE